MTRTPSKISKPKLYDLLVTRGVSFHEAEVETGIHSRDLRKLAEMWKIPYEHASQKLKEKSFGLAIASA